MVTLTERLLEAHRGSALVTERELRAAQTVPRLPFARLTARAGRADRMAKGLASGDPWDELALLAVELCGVRTLPLLRAG